MQKLKKFVAVNTYCTFSLHDILLIFQPCFLKKIFLYIKSTNCTWVHVFYCFASTYITYITTYVLRGQYHEIFDFWFLSSKKRLFEFLYGLIFWLKTSIVSQVEWQINAKNIFIFPCRSSTSWESKKSKSVPRGCNGTVLEENQKLRISRYTVPLSETFVKTSMMASVYLTISLTVERYFSVVKPFLQLRNRFLSQISCKGNVSWD